MNKPVHYFKFTLIALLSLAVASLFMACGAAPATSVPRPTPEDVEVAVVPPPTPSTPATPTPPPAIMAPDDGCVECHSSEEILKENVEEEMIGEALSEGEG